MNQTYSIARTGRTGAFSIKCERCGMTSCSAKDVINLYCGFCHDFHEAATGNWSPSIQEEIERREQEKETERKKLNVR